MQFNFGEISPSAGGGEKCFASGRETSLALGETLHFFWSVSPLGDHAFLIPQKSMEKRRTKEGG